MNIEELIRNSQYKTRTLNCHGCDNNCLVVRYDFGDGKVYFSGNRCEKIFNNGGKAKKTGRSSYEAKLKLLFDRAKKHPDTAVMKIGIPRVLNMFEDFPFWHSLLTNCGMDVVLSDPSDMRRYEANARMVMSDNICFPAKLVHAHLADLQEKGVDRIFFPFVVHGPRGKDQNSYNCPIVAGYSQVVKDFPVKIDAPVFSMKDEKLFYNQCVRYLKSIGVDEDTIRAAFDNAICSEKAFNKNIAGANHDIFNSKRPGELTILLAGRPYHSDPLIQHKAAEMIASLGVDVISDDIVRDIDLPLDGITFLSQWTYTNRILRAAKWCAQQGPDVQFVELTSFGCGPDAFLTDAVRDLLARYGKSLTLLKLDDISNVGSMKLRVRSLIDSLSISGTHEEASKPYVTTPVFEKKDSKKNIIAPFFTPFLSPLIPAGMSNAGYNVICLPESDEESAEIGLKYANNEVCYPATLVVGDIIRALQSGKYDPANTAVAMTQTGGQCRASNYLPLIKKAMVDAGFGNIPVISVNFSSGIQNDQPGFKINWVKMMPLAVYTVLFSDCLAKLYYPTAVRCKGKKADELKDKYLKKACDLLYEGRYKEQLPLINEAAKEFDSACDDSRHKRVGIVGEIYLKFNPYAHRRLPQWLMQRGVEIAPPILTDFFIQFFVNRKTNKKSMVEKGGLPNWLLNRLYSLFQKYVKMFNEACSGFRFYEPFNDIFMEAKNASEVISLSTQFGEGWLLPGEVVTYYREGIKNVISMQPFGCIANHIVVRGVEKRIKRKFPDINLLAIDFDGGVSEVNIINRALLFLDNLK